MAQTIRYRALDPNGDFTFGRGRSEFLVNSSAAVAQAVQTALKLIQGEWFLDVTAGVPWNTQILGTGTSSLYDAAIKDAILGVQGVASIVSYSSSLNTSTRSLSVAVTITTIYSGAVPVSFGVQIPIVPAPLTGYGYSAYGQFPFGAA